MAVYCAWVKMVAEIFFPLTLKVVAIETAEETPHPSEKKEEEEKIRIGDE